MRSLIKRFLARFSESIASRVSSAIGQDIQTVNRQVHSVGLQIAELDRAISEVRLALGQIHAKRVADLGPRRNLHSAEFKVFSQWGEDGIIQYLIHQVPIENTSFIEFGVENYRESNTRFLLINDNWRGLVMDSSSAYMQAVREDPIYWRYDLTAQAHFVTPENINGLIAKYSPDRDLGILSIDIDGNDYWVWDAITAVEPRIVICEYNSVFGSRAAISVPYDPNFSRKQAHHSYLFWGASLAAFCHLAQKKGYVFVGSNSAGCNAFFVRKDVASNLVTLTPEEGYVMSRYRESRSEFGELNYLSGAERAEVIEDMEVCDVISGQLYRLKNVVAAPANETRVGYSRNFS